MRELVLTRKLESNQGTFGSLSGPGLFLYTAELPWRANRSGLSRIPAGSYRGRAYSSAKFKNCYEIVDVPGREKILIHAGNWAGDIKAGLRSDVQGCILVGLEVGELRGQQALLSSGAAMQKLRDWLGRESFSLEIREAFPALPGAEPKMASSYRPPSSASEKTGDGPDYKDPDAAAVNAAAIAYEEFINPAHSSELAWLPDFDGETGGMLALSELGAPGNWQRSREGSFYERGWY